MHGAPSGSSLPSLVVPSDPHATIFLKKETVCGRALRLSPRDPLSLPSTGRAAGSLLGVGPAGHHPDAGSRGTRGVGGMRGVRGMWRVGDQGELGGTQGRRLTCGLSPCRSAKCLQTQSEVCVAVLKSNPRNSHGDVSAPQSTATSPAPAWVVEAMPSLRPQGNRWLQGSEVTFSEGFSRLAPGQQWGRVYDGTVSTC